MKVLHLLPTLNWSGGVETYVLNLLPLLGEQGIDSIVAFGAGDKDLWKNSVHIPELNRLGWFDILAGYKQLGHLIREHRPSIVHVHHINNVGAIQACVELCPSILTTHGYQYICAASDFAFDATGEICERRCANLSCYLVTWFRKCMSRNPRHAVGVLRRVRWGLRNAHRFASFVAPSAYAAERYISAGFPRERFHVLPYFCPILPRAVPRKEPEVPTILFIGRLYPAKGYRVFVHALAMLREVRGVMVGNVNTPSGSEIKRLAVKLDVADRLELMNWVAREQIPNLFERATILVVPSLFPETLGVVGLEALSMGVPVVASDVGGIREWLIPGKTGLLVPANDARALASAVQSLLNCAELRREMGKNGLDLIRSKFLPSEHVRRLIQIYYEAIEVSNDQVRADKL
jgi:glycosyltransferase involved in cell wall biosynthesis